MGAVTGNAGLFEADRSRERLKRCSVEAYECLLQCYKRYMSYNVTIAIERDRYAVSEESPRAGKVSPPSVIRVPHPERGWDDMRGLLGMEIAFSLSHFSSPQAREVT